MGLKKLLITTAVSGVLLGLVLFGICFYFRESFAAAGDLGSNSARTWSVFILAIPAFVLGWGLSFIFESLTESSDWTYWLALALFGGIVLATTLLLGYRFLPLSFMGILPPAILSGLVAPLPSAIKAWMEE